MNSDGGSGPTDGSGNSQYIGGQANPAYQPPYIQPSTMPNTDFSTGRSSVDRREKNSSVVYTPPANISWITGSSSTSGGGGSAGGSSSDVAWGVLVPLLLLFGAAGLVIYGPSLNRDRANIASSFGSNEQSYSHHPSSSPSVPSSTTNTTYYISVGPVKVWSEEGKGKVLAKLYKGEAVHVTLRGTQTTVVADDGWYKITTPSTHVTGYVKGKQLSPDQDTTTSSPSISAPPQIHRPAAPPQQAPQTTRDEAEPLGTLEASYTDQAFLCRGITYKVPLATGFETIDETTLLKARFRLYKTGEDSYTRVIVPHEGNNGATYAEMSYYRSPNRTFYVPLSMVSVDPTTCVRRKEGSAVKTALGL